MLRHGDIARSLDGLKEWVPMLIALVLGIWIGSSVAAMWFYTRMRGKL